MHSKETKMKNNRIINELLGFILMLCVGKSYIAEAVDCNEAGIML